MCFKEKAIKQHFKRAISNRAFLDLVKPFLSKKGCLAGNDISLIKNNEIVTDEKQLTEIFNDHYINIVEKSSG